MRLPEPDMGYVQRVMLDLLKIPSPTGFTDEVVHYTGERLEDLGIPFNVTRRGAIRANMDGRESSPDRAIVAHLDTIGCIVKRLKDNGRLAIASIGTWSSRFAEGARVTVFTRERRYRGTILPLLA
ncbi:MAG TPA: osmoprotectant NAGGN system M42 family peptidase, partial [Gammaproteobacteria bacterium]